MPRTHHQRPTPYNRRRAFSRAGFSLLELVMVLAIAGVLAAIAAPRMAASTARQRALSAAKRVAADLEAARAAAMATSTSRRVVFSPEKASYATPDAASPLDAGLTYLVDLSVPPYNAALYGSSFDDPASLRWGPAFDDTPVQQVVFDGFGRPDSAGWVLVHSGEFFYKVTLDAWGRASIAPITRAAADLDISESPGTTPVGEAE